MLQRSRLLRSSTSSMTATESMTMITLAARPARRACRAQKPSSNTSETIPATNATSATMARTRVLRTSASTDRERRGPGSWRLMTWPAYALVDLGPLPSPASRDLSAPQLRSFGLTRDRAWGVGLVGREPQDDAAVRADRVRVVLADVLARQRVDVV